LTLLHVPYSLKRCTFRQAESAAADAASTLAASTRSVETAEATAAREGARADTAGLYLEGLALDVGFRVLGFRVSCLGVKKATGENVTGVSADTADLNPEIRNSKPRTPQTEPETQTPKAVSKIKAG